MRKAVGADTWSKVEKVGQDEVAEPMSSMNQAEKRSERVTNHGKR